MQVGDIRFTWTGEHFSIAGRGLVYTATLDGRYFGSQLSKLNGQTVENPDGVFCRIRGVEMAMVGEGVAHRAIGLLLEPLERPF